MAAPLYDIPLGEMGPRGSALYPNRGKERGLGFFKPRSSYKIHSLILLGFAVALLFTVLGVGVELSKEKTRYNSLNARFLGNGEVAVGNASTTGTGLLNGANGTNSSTCPDLTSTDPQDGAWTSVKCTTESWGNCTATLSQEQVNQCFYLAMDVCNAEYNATHPIPQKNTTLWMSRPECTHVLFTMYCQLTNFTAPSGYCPAMKPFCEQEYVPLYNTSNWPWTTYKIETYTTTVSVEIPDFPSGTGTSTIQSTGLTTQAFQSQYPPAYTHKRRELTAYTPAMPTDVDETPTSSALMPASATPAPTIAPGKKCPEGRSDIC